MGRRFAREAVFTPEIPRVLDSPLDAETAYLLGLWLAEGYISRGKIIDVCLSEHESDLIKRVSAWAERLGRKVYEHPTKAGGAVNVGFSHAQLARFIVENFGAGSHHKRLPGWAFTLPPNLFLAMVSGWVAGDGWQGEDGHVEVTTTSRELGIGMLWACRMHGIWSTMSAYHYKGFGSGIAYRLKFSKANNPWNSYSGKKRAKRVQPRIKSITKLPFDGYVYDLCGCAGEAFYGGEMPILLHNTNIPNVIDPALRRPGRFDREIEIGIPDRNGRMNIMQIHTRGMPLAEDVDVEKLAEITHGFVGADLEALAREAAMTALRRIFPVISSDLEEVPYETILRLEVTMPDFREALREVEPSAIREVFVEVPNVRWSDVGGLGEVKQRLVEAVEWPLTYAKLFARARTKAPKGILLHGRPGTGKTLLAKAVATETDVNFIAVKGAALLSKYVGESERAVRELFKKARQAAPCILFLDELDAMAPTRGGLNGDTHVMERVISQLLTELDGIEELRGVVVLGATNRLDIIDPALLRPGRFDLLLQVPVPDRQARRQIFEVHTARKPLGPDVDVECLAEQTEGAVGADLEGICQEASLHAIREVVQHSANDAAADMPLTITMGHFEKALAEWEARARLG